MQLSDLIPFLGHSSIHQPFDDFLSSNSISKRPKIGKSLELDIIIDNQGLMLTFEFDTAAKEQNIAIKSEGSFVFKSIYVTLLPETKKLGKYVEALPFNLASSDSRLAVEQKLGVPRRRNEQSDNYFLDGMVVTPEFEGEKFQFLRLELPRDGLRKHGLCH